MLHDSTTNTRWKTKQLSRIVRDLCLNSESHHSVYNSFQLTQQPFWKRWPCVSHLLAFSTIMHPQFRVTLIIFFGKSAQTYRSEDESCTYVSKNAFNITFRHTSIIQNRFIDTGFLFSWYLALYVETEIR